MTIDDRTAVRRGRVSLRLVRESDCSETYLGWLLDPQVNAYLETRWSSQSLPSVLAFVRACREDPLRHLFAIIDERDPDAPVHVGNLKIGPVDPHQATADISYFLGDPTSWGQGLGTDAVAAGVTIAFEHLDLHRLQAGVHASNEASRRVLERNGFQLEGRLRDSAIVKGRREDGLVLGLVPSLAAETDPHPHDRGSE